MNQGESNSAFPEAELSILIIDDEEVCRELQRELSGAHTTVRSVASTAEALACLEAETPDIILLDLRLAGATGAQFLKEVRSRGHDSEVIILTAQPSVNCAVVEFFEEAYDYLSKPVDPAILQRTVRRALERRLLQRENQALRTALAPRLQETTLSSASSIVQHAIHRLPKIATSNSTVLISGEIGSGKQLFAREIHRLSSRHAEPLVIVDCGSLRGAVLGDELFGHERGAFAGASQARPGLFEAAHQGTIYLDEVGELDSESQASLLQVLENSSVSRIGATRSRRIDVRVIAATHRNLNEEAAAGRFRKDLLHRMQVSQVDTPPLRERKEDLKSLFRMFLRQHCRAGQPPTPTPSAWQAMFDYHWPGNIRELRNLAAMVAVTVDGDRIELEDLPLCVKVGKLSVAPARKVVSLKELEKQHILGVYKDCNGNKKEASEILGIALRTLYNKLEEYNQSASQLKP